MEALRKAEEAKRRLQQEEQLAADNVTQADLTQAARKRPSGSAANAASPPQAAFSLEEREPGVTPEYIFDTFVSAGDSSESVAELAPEIADSATRSAIAGRLNYAPYTTDADAAGTAARARAHAEAKKQQRAAASVFVAKQHPPHNRQTLKVLLILLVLLLPTGGGVLWYLQTLVPSGVGVNPAIASYNFANRGFLGDTAPQAPAGTGSTPPAAAAASATASVDEASPVALAEAVPQAAVAIPGTDQDTAVETGNVAAIQPPAATAVAAVEVDGGPALPASGGAANLQISRSSGLRTSNPQLQSAYERMQAGDLLLAGQLYQEVLMALPNNRDALLGLALVRFRQNDAVAARALYARLLQLNPRDPLARTGLMQTVQLLDPVAHENELRTLLNEFPDVAPLSMALGNLYASQQRWSEAQGAYYNALLAASRGTEGPVNPDYAFNLAVSLEQLNQRKAALDYYRQAQALALAVAPGFDPQLLNSRLAYLEQNQP